MSDNQRPIIALLTDFGTSDPYVGIMKGVIAGICPAATLIDISHAVSPQHVAQGAYLLRSAYRHFPARTIFLCVVDPGVGTDRRPIAARTAHGLYVGPDNGLFGLVFEEIPVFEAVQLTPLPDMSDTFHGRDLFAPTAATLASGTPLEKLGTPIADSMMTLALHADHPAPGVLSGEVIHIDHFGDIITSLGPFAWRDDGTLQGCGVTFAPESVRIQIDDYEISGIRRTYGQMRPGGLMALISSDGMVEIAINQGHAAQHLKVAARSPIRLVFTEES